MWFGLANVTSDPTYKVPEGQAGVVPTRVCLVLCRWPAILGLHFSCNAVCSAGGWRWRWSLYSGGAIGEAIIIYTITAAHALIFTGGQYVVQTQRLFMRGAAGPLSLCEFDDNHFVISPDQMYIHDGVTATRVGQQLFDMEFFKRAVNLETATISHDPPNKEIWIYFDTNYGRKGAIYNYSTGTFGWHDGLARKDRPVSYASRGYLPQTGATWGSMRTSWKNASGP